MRLEMGQGVISFSALGGSRPRPERLAAHASVLGLDLEGLRELAHYQPWSSAGETTPIGPCNYTPLVRSLLAPLWTWYG